LIVSNGSPAARRGPPGRRHLQFPFPGGQEPAAPGGSDGWLAVACEPSYHVVMTGQTSWSPPWWRVVAAFVAAPAVAALAFSSVSPLYEGLPDYPERVLRTFPLVAVVGGYLPALIIGLPALLFLRRRVRPTIVNCALAGATVAALPWLLLTLFPAADSASIGGRPTVVDHHLTWFGLYEGMKVIGEVAAFGLVGGLVFWILAILGYRKGRPASA